MTACVNNENCQGGGASSSKIVSATLVGALAIGMVPAVAFADEVAPETTVDDNIDLLAVDPAEAFSQGKVTKAIDNKGNAVTDFEFAASSETYLVPTEVTPAESAPVDVTGDDYKITYFLADKDGNPTGDPIDNPTAVGNYVAKVTAVNGEYAGGEALAKFSIVAGSLSGASVYEVNEKDLTDVSDTTFTYNGALQKIGVAVDGKALESGVDYTVRYYLAGGDMSGDQTDPKNVGNYVAVIDGMGIYAGSHAQAAFSIGALDLAATDIVINDMEGVASAPTAEEVMIGDLPGAGLVKVDFKSAADGSLVFGNNTTYTYTVSPASNNKNVINSKDVTFDKVAANADITYEGNPFSDQDVNLTDKDSFIDVSKIAVKGTDGKDLDEKQYTITVTDADGNSATIDDLKKPGTWILKVKVDAAATKYALGGSAQMKVNVIAGEIDADASLFFKYDETVWNGSINATFDGSNLLDSIEVVLKDSKGNVLTQGTDYEVKVTKEGKPVTEIVDAGAYQISVTSSVYTLTNASSIDVVVAPINIGDVRVVNTVEFSEGESFIAYTGEAITPAIEYLAEVAPDGTKIYKALPTDTYKLSYKYLVNGEFKDVKEMLEVGTYQVMVAQNEDVSNYQFAPSLMTTATVSDRKVFADVPNDAWFAKSVYDAASEELGYMKGYYGTKLFGPYNSITRADVACVLYNMAGGKTYQEGTVNDFSGYATKFSDVDKGMYYAQALGWAAKAGVVHGYSDGTFAPEQSITREEFAAMLANYAKVLGDFEAVDVDATLASFPDGSAVSDWAKESVAWAAANKVMGNGGVLNPSSVITRAEVAAMAVNYQPEKIDSIL